MKWIKASERLPEKWSTIIWRYVSDKRRVLKSNNYIVTDKKNYDLYEWLDESEDQETLSLRAENERLRGVMKQLYVMYNREVMFPDKLEKYWKEFLTENNL